MRLPEPRKKQRPWKRTKPNRRPRQQQQQPQKAKAKAEAKAAAVAAKEKESKDKEAQKGKNAEGNKKGTTTIAQQAQNTELPPDLDD
jgi:hypothetical protein